MFGRDISIFVVFMLSSYSYSALTMTLPLPAIDHHVEFLSNRTYRDFYLRQYFFSLLNHSQPAVIQTTHQLIPQLEQSLFFFGSRIFAKNIYSFTLFFSTISSKTADSLLYSVIFHSFEQLFDEKWQ